MSELRDLYQEVILDHSKRPRNFRCIDGASNEAKGHNPLCGDRLTLWVDVKDGAIADIAFQGDGCAISKASASLMTEAVKGQTLAQTRHLFDEFHQLLTGPGDAEPPEDLDKLAVFSGVREYPVRVKCATLPWHTLAAALDKSAQPAKTE
jgi:nitrogen fixation NifU-like protein